MLFINPFGVYLVDISSPEALAADRKALPHRGFLSIRSLLELAVVIVSQILVTTSKPHTARRALLAGWPRRQGVLYGTSD